MKQIICASCLIVILTLPLPFIDGLGEIIEEQTPIEKKLESIILSKENADVKRSLSALNPFGKS